MKLKSRHLFRLTFLTGLVVFLFSSSPLFAQQPFEAEVEFFIRNGGPESQFTVGDQIILHLEIRHPADSRVVLPQVEEPWDVFTVVDQTAPQVVDNGDGTATTGKDIVVALFQPGQYETPLIIVTHRKPDGSIEELATPIIPINIVSILTEDDLELRDLKAQAQLPEAALWPYILAAGILTAIVIGLLAALLFWWFYWRKQQTVTEAVPVGVTDLRPPEVVAYAELERIEGLRLPARNQIKEHYALVSICLRRYIEGRYDVSAVEQTTTELKSAFAKTDVPANEIRQLINIVNESDFVKFARYRPHDNSIYNLIKNAREVIDETTTAVKSRTKEDEISLSENGTPSENGAILQNEVSHGEGAYAVEITSDAPDKDRDLG